MNWTIKSRLIAGCVVLLVVIAIACSYGLQQMSSAERAIVAIAKRGDANVKRLVASHDAKEALLTARQNESQFRLLKKTTEAETVLAEIKTAREALRTISIDGEAEGTLTKSSAAALKSSDTYEKAFNSLVSLLTKRGLTPDQGAEGELRKAVHSVETLVNEQNLADLSVLMLMCRRHEKDYLLRADPKYLGEIAKRIEEFSAQMKKLDLPAEFQTKATSAFQVYFTQIQAIADIDKTVVSTAASLEVAAKDFTTQVEAVNASVVDAIAHDQKTSMNVMATGRTVMLILLCVGVCLGVVVAIVLTRSINPPLEAAVIKLQSFVTETTSAAGQISVASSTLAEGSSEQAASLEETSASLEEMASMTKRNAESAQNAKQLAGQARTVVESAATGMQRMTAAMDGIKTSSDEIAKIIKTIDEIAFQTNILALNAAVEAARAGEAGSGFAVVAEEVRSLAQRSAQAAKETANKIEAALIKSEEGSRSSNEVSAILSEIVTQVRSMDTLVAEIASASGEQSQGIDQVNIAVSQMDKVTQSNAAGAEESAAAAQELNAQSIELQALTNSLGQLIGVANARATAGAHKPMLHAPAKHLVSPVPQKALSRNASVKSPAAASARKTEENASFF